MDTDHTDNAQLVARGDFADLIANKEDLLPLIEQFRGGAKLRWSFDRVQSAVDDLWAKYGCNQAYSIPPKFNSHPFTLHRVRKLKSGDYAHEFRSVDDLGARKKEDVTDYGRCHWPKFPLCYCSLYEDIALAEVDAELGDCCVITTYQLTQELCVVPVGELDYYRHIGQTYLGDDHSKAKECYRSVNDDADGKLRVLVDAFFADEFIKPAHTPSDYKVTASLSSVLLDKNNAKKKVDAIFYPSVAFRAGYNFAIRPQSVDAKMKLVEAETRIVKISDVLGYGIFEYDIVAVLKSVDEFGSLEWSVAGEP